MKKARFALLMMVIAVILCACSSEDEQSSEQTPVPGVTGGQETAAPDSTAEPDKTAEPVVFNDPSWAKTAVFYEIFVRNFYDSDGNGIGDFKGIEEKIPYLKELGVDAVWLMPMMEATKYHGYDVVDYRSVEQDYGTMEDFESLVKACHDNDIRIIIDFVVNHTSIENAWFQDAIYNDNSPYRDYYFIYDSKKEVPKGMGNMKKHAETGKYFYANYDFIMPDLNYSNQKVRDEIKDIAGFWLDKGIDGFRLDGSKEIDVDANITHSWWKEFSNYVAEKNPAAFVVGENWIDGYGTLAPYYSDMISSFDFPLCYAIEKVALGNVTDILTPLLKGRTKFEKAANAQDSASSMMIDSTMIGNHDINRIYRRMKENKGRTKLAAALQFTLPGTPFIYYGEELGQNSSSSDQSKREPFDWYRSAKGTGMTVFIQGENDISKYTLPDDGISLEEEESDPESIYNYYKKLIEIRKSNPVLFEGNYETLGIRGALFAYTVAGAEDGSSLLIIHNTDEKEESFKICIEGKDLLTDNSFNAGSDVSIPGLATMIIKYDSQDRPLSEEEFPKTQTKEVNMKFTVTLPEGTPADDKIYIVGNFNGWNPNDETMQLTRTSDNTAEITMALDEGTVISYKYTRGSWAMREQNTDHQDRLAGTTSENRRATIAATEQKDVIEAWSDIK